MMVFKGIRASCHIKLNLNGVDTERVNEIKFLGVMMDHKLWLEATYRTNQMEIIAQSKRFT